MTSEDVKPLIDEALSIAALVPTSRAGEVLVALVGVIEASAVSTPPTITEKAVERGAKALWVADQDDAVWASAVVDDAFSPADDWPQECIEYAERARAALAAALHPGGETNG